MKRSGRCPTLFFLSILTGFTPRVLAAQRIGEFTVSGGASQGAESGGLGTRAALASSFAFVRSSFSLGPEVLFIPGTPKVYGFNAAARFRLGRSDARPYLVGSLGGYSWRQPQFVSTNLFTGSLGAGLRLGGEAGRERFTLEARYHDNLQRIQSPGRWALFTLLGGLRFGW